MAKECQDWETDPNMDEDDVEYEGEYGQHEGELQELPGEEQKPQYEGSDTTEITKSLTNSIRWF